MFFLLSGAEKKKKAPVRKVENLDKVKELFLTGRFPVTTTTDLDEERRVGKVLGLVVSRGYDSEDAFYDMAARAVNKGAQAIIGYQENVAFHPDGSKFFTCYGTAVQFESARANGALPSLSARA
ncbi:MAG: YbjQ family protein [Deltaproteobacteria bacterium]|nr:YbjQ family protein [Deltaproteobacteria bacterium]